MSLSSANVPSLMDVSFLDPIETGQRVLGPEGQNGARDPRKDTREVANEARRGSGAMLAGVETKRARVKTMLARVEMKRARVETMLARVEVKRASFKTMRARVRNERARIKTVAVLHPDDGSLLYGFR